MLRVRFGADTAGCAPRRYQSAEHERLTLSSDASFRLEGVWLHSILCLGTLLQANADGPPLRLLDFELVCLSDEVAALSKLEGKRIKVCCKVEQLLANSTEGYPRFLGFFLGKNSI